MADVDERAETSPLLPKRDDDDDRRSSAGSLAALDDAAFPTDWRWTAEYRLVLRYSIPLTVTYLLQYLVQIIIVLVASRLSTDELAGVSLGITTSNIVGYAVFEGMATTLDTLCSQAYGASQPHLVGLHCVRFAVYIHMVALPIVTLWLFSAQILEHLVPSVQLAHDAGTFLRWTIVGVPGYAVFEVGKRFMQAQGNFNAGLVVLVLNLPISAAFNYLLVFHLKWRVAGAALAAALTNAVRPLLLLAYILLADRGSLRCWPPNLTRKRLFSDWGPMVRLSIPGALLTLSEWFAFEILTFATSYVGTAQLAAQTFLGTTSVILWHITFAASVATSTRIGHMVGAGLIDTAKRAASSYAGLFTAIGIMDVGLTVGILMLVARFVATDDEVRDIVTRAAIFVACFCFFDSTCSGVYGIFKGLGWQAVGGWMSLLINYTFAVPLSLGLMLGAPKMGVRGIYIGIGSGLAASTVFGSIILSIRPWERVRVQVEDEDT